MTGQGTILLLGANGQVGFEVCRLAQKKDIPLTALGRRDLDLGDIDALANNLQGYQPDLVINAAAYTAVDKAELEPERSFQVNGGAPAIIAEFCHLKKIPLLHLSTDYVFDGSSKTPYNEDDSATPSGIYGESKLEGEQAICRKLKKHIIIRTSWVFGPHGNNFVKTILGLAKTNNELKIVADQYGCPTSATSIAKVLLDLAGRIRKGENMPWGIYHYCGKPATTWHGFAEKIIDLAASKKILNQQVAVKKITTADYPTPARRPPNSTLNCEKIINKLKLQQPNWQHDLNIMLDSLI